MDLRQFECDGFSVHEQVLPRALREPVLLAFGSCAGGGPGSRGGLASPAIVALARSSQVRALIDPVLGPAAFAYRATLFDKSEASNWPVAWHQDRVVPVLDRIDANGFTNWSQKPEGIYVEPPPTVQEQCVAIRVDLDGSGPHNGGLQLRPGSHRQGVLTPAQIESALQCGRDQCPKVVSGGALRMRPLLLHRSARSLSRTHRRIVHLEFCATELTGGPNFARHVRPASE